MKALLAVAVTACGPDSATVGGVAMEASAVVRNASTTATRRLTSRSTNRHGPESDRDRASLR
jgi:hypothetical protein